MQIAETVNADKTSDVEWSERTARSREESLFKNLAVASALVLCAVTLRTGALPSLQNASDIVMTAATDNSLLDDQLGKLSFVSTLFPEAVLVFGSSNADKLSFPVNDGFVVHAWSEAEPYISWQTESPQVIAASAGEVTGIYHGNGDERLIQVSDSYGLSCLYGNMSKLFVKMGDAVNTGDVLGELLTGADLVLEVRKEGFSIDPAIYFSR